MYSLQLTYIPLYSEALSFAQCHLSFAILFGSRFCSRLHLALSRHVTWQWAPPWQWGSAWYNYTSILEMEYRIEASTIGFWNEQERERKLHCPNWNPLEIPGKIGVLDVSQQMQLRPSKNWNWRIDLPMVFASWNHCQEAATNGALHGKPQSRKVRKPNLLKAWRFEVSLENLKV